METEMASSKTQLKTSRARRAKLVRICVDGGMTLALCAIMATPLVHDVAHEWLGIALVALVAVHLFLHRRFIKGLGRGRWSARRVMLTVVDVSLLVCLVIMAASSIVLSGHVFGWMPAIPGAVWARPAHMLCSHWMAAFVGIHVGIHVPHSCAQLKQIATAIALSVLAAFGLWSFCNLGFWGYMSGSVPFFNASFVTPIAWRSFQYFGIVALFAWGAWLIASIVHHSRKGKTSEKGIQESIDDSSRRTHGVRVLRLRRAVRKSVKRSKSNESIGQPE